MYVCVSSQIIYVPQVLSLHVLGMLHALCVCVCAGFGFHFVYAVVCLCACSDMVMHVGLSHFGCHVFFTTHVPLPQLQLHNSWQQLLFQQLVHVHGPWSLP